MCRIAWSVPTPNVKSASTFQEYEEINKRGQKYHAKDVTQEPHKMPCTAYQVLNYQ